MIRQFLYPEFDCETCHGMSGYPCECDYHGAVAPGVGPSNLIRRLRRIWSHVAIDFGRDVIRQEGVAFQFAVFRRPGAECGSLAYRLSMELHLSWRRGFVFWGTLHPAWKDVESVRAEYELTMTPRPYRDSPTDELTAVMAIAKREINTTYGRFDAPAVDLVATYGHLQEIRRELRLRKAA